MAEKYLGKQGLAKLIELVKANSGRGALTVKDKEVWVDTGVTPENNSNYAVTFYGAAYTFLIYISVDSKGVKSNTRNVIVNKHFTSGLVFISGTTTSKKASPEKNDTIHVGLKACYIGEGDADIEYTISHINVKKL